MARDLRLFYLFRLLATSHLFVPIAITFFASRGLGFDRAMLLNTIWCGSVLLFDVPTGALADRIGRRRTMMLGALLMSAACLVFYFAHDFVTFAIASSLSALAMTLTSGADSAYLYDMLSDAGLEHEYPRREGTASAWHLIGSTLAFSAGGIAAKFSLGLPYLLTAGTSLCALLVAFRMREERAPATVSVSLSPRRLWRTYVSHIKMAISEISLRRQLRWTIGYSAVVFVLVRVTDYMYPPYLGAAGFGVMATGFIFAGLYLVAAAVAHNMDSLRQSLSEWRLLVGLPLLLVGSNLLMGRFVASWAIAFMLGPALVTGAFSPLVKSVMNRAIPSSDRRATILSFESMARRLAFGAFSPVLGVLVHRWSVSTGFYLCAGFGFVGVLVFAWRPLRAGSPVVPIAAPAAPPQPGPSPASGERAA